MERRFCVNRDSVKVKVWGGISRESRDMKTELKPLIVISQLCDMCSTLETCPISHISL